jgi:hypothetical protein
MEEPVLVELIESLGKIFSPSTSNQQRQICQKVVDDITNSSTGILYASKLAHAVNGFSDQLRHFGCSALYNSVKFQWANMSQDQQSYLKNTALELLRTVFNDHLYLGDKGFT